MKEIKAFIIVLILSLFVISCNKKNTNNSGSITKKAPLKVGMELKWPPFETITEDGKPTGISVDLAYELGKYLDRDIEIVDTSFGSLIPALETGKIDIIIASMSITKERAEKINFSKPYFYFSLVTLLNKNSNIKDKKELFSREGLKFVGPKSFVALKIPKEKANNPKLLEFDDKSSAVLEVVQGKADAFIIDAIAASEFYSKYPEQTEILWDPVEQAKIGMGLRKSDTELLEKVNTFINDLEKNGVYKRLAEKYNSIIDKSLPGQTLDFYTTPIGDE
ncbi:polar amino acid transport system substrate-binding protein [Hypnocyclicus thermotrophus]|uniref:Polar amino acid transport system substrate-binding protein n=1 Tax=Hypnocyclicus thermotrophus TaxID=1627895 RepID=A0AA46DY91_9FUSO|nr:transporter substrate-binding domain-containing protein [Hypnocyclicus thermotrophus]TDT69232.1 polar amino acid transport system substrate-binding protein [Hypnocyclicus thermotrophus]